MKTCNQRRVKKKSVMYTIRRELADSNMIYKNKNTHREKLKNY